MFLFLSPLTFFGLPLFLFLFLCLYLSLVFLSSFLAFFFALFLFLVFVSFSFFFLLCFCFMKRTTWTFSIAMFFLKYFLSFGFLSCFSVSNPFFLSLLFPDFKLCFCSTSMFLVSKRTNWKSQKTNKNKLQQNGFFYEPVFCKMWKVIVFFCPFLPNFGSCSKNTIKIGISAHF